jgi:hypothetical protein
MTAAELAFHARKSIRRERRIWHSLGLLMLVLGGAVGLIPLLANDLGEVFEEVFEDTHKS